MPSLPACTPRTGARASAAPAAATAVRLLCWGRPERRRAGARPHPPARPAAAPAPHLSCRRAPLGPARTGQTLTTRPPGCERPGRESPPGAPQRPAPRPAVQCPPRPCCTRTAPCMHAPAVTPQLPPAARRPLRARPVAPAPPPAPRLPCPRRPPQAGAGGAGRKFPGPRRGVARARRTLPKNPPRQRPERPAAAPGPAPPPAAPKPPR
jgi:DnaK suppressor protein